MSRTVFVLGAGTSKEAGGPMMAEFLDVADGLRKSSDVGPYSESFDLVFRGVAALQSVHSKSTLDLDNVESVFAAFEMAALFERPLGSVSLEEVKELPAAMRRVIAHTLQRRIAFVHTGDQVVPPVPYPKFVNLIEQLRRNRPEEVSVITFNYDLGLDYAFHFSTLPIDYGIGLRTQAQALLFMKLHGSLNWTRCTQCNSIFPWYLDEFFSSHRWERFSQRGHVYLDITGKIQSSLQHCSKPRSSDPFIVPPTWNKTQHYQEIQKVWKTAAKQLSDAENIFILGYSFPETDQFFRYLFALGTVGDARLQRLWVFDPDESGQLKARYEALLGPMARRRFKYVPFIFSGAIKAISNELGLNK